MAVYQVLAVALIGLIFLVLLRRERPELAVLLSVAVGLVLLFTVLAQIRSLLDLLVGLITRAELDLHYAGSLIRIVGIAYLTEFGSQVCRDAGEASLAGKVELAGKVAILILAVPIMLAVVETLLLLLPT